MVSLFMKSSFLPYLIITLILLAIVLFVVRSNLSPPLTEVREGEGAVIGCASTPAEEDLTEYVGMITDEGCMVHAAATANAKQYGMPNQAAAIEASIRQCLTGLGIPDPLYHGLRAEDVSWLAFCKKIVMESYGIKVDVQYILYTWPGYGGTTFAGVSPFKGRCPPPSAMPLEITMFFGISFGLHAVACTLQACNPDTGEASLDCQEHSNQGGNQYHVEVNPDSTSTLSPPQPLMSSIVAGFMFG